MPTARELLRGVAVALAYVLLAWLASRFAVLDTLTVWYAPAGLAIGLGVVAGWRVLPAIALGEVLVGLLLFGVADDFGWLVVPNGIAYAAVYVGAGVAIRRSGAVDPDPRRRRLPVLFLLVAGGTALAAVVGVGFQLAADVTLAADVPAALLLWWLGDVVGVAGVGTAVVAIAVRARRGGRWWAVPETPVVQSTALLVLPAVLTVAVALVADGVAPFAAAVFLPTVALAVRGGIPAVALAAPLTSFAMSGVADARFGSDALALSDLQLVLLLLLLTGFGVAAVLEERGELQVRLATDREHLREAERIARSGSFRWDVPDDRVEWSDGLFDLFGTARTPVGAGDYLRRVRPADRDRVAAALQRALETGEPQEHTYGLVRDDGDELVVRARLEARTHDGRVVELLGTCTDVTAEEEVAQRLADLVAREQVAREAQEAAREAIARTERIKDALLVAVSHQVRTPLTVLRGLLETLRRPELREDRIGDHDHHFDGLQRHLDRLTRVLRDLLDVDRIGRGVVAPVVRPCDLTALAEEVLTELNGQQGTVELDLPDDPVHLDARLFARILEQLLVNARRHGGEDAVVRVAAQVDDERLLLRVDDDGPGVPAADRARVFGAFEHGDVPAHSPGAGVGLYLVARFAELHGGRAWVTEPAGSSGASFRVELPLDAVAPDPTAPSHAGAGAAAPATPTGSATEQAP